MKYLLMAMALIMPALGFAQGIERTVRPIFDPARELQAIQMIPACAPGVPVGVSGTRLVCLTHFANDDLAFGQHSSAQCTNLGGEMVTDGADKFCRFTLSACPSGWAQFKSWDEYKRERVTGGTNFQSCMAPAIAWSNVSDVSRCGYWCGSGECGAGGRTITLSGKPAKIGCY